MHGAPSTRTPSPCSDSSERRNAAAPAIWHDSVSQTRTVIGAPCIGRCEHAPAAVVGQCTIDEATTQKITDAVAQKRVTAEVPALIDYAAYRAAGGYKLYVACINGERRADDVIAEMENSGLRGLGGAGFPTGRKWKIVRAEPAPRLMAVNIDEGEPGTFKDRWYLERDPHRFLEGMLIAAWAVDIAAIYIYLRDEYHGCRAVLEAELAKLQANPPVSGLPGSNCGAAAVI